jgi:hypothetical protein
VLCFHYVVYRKWWMVYRKWWNDHGHHSNIYIYRNDRQCWMIMTYR